MHRRQFLKLFFSVLGAACPTVSMARSLRIQSDDQGPVPHAANTPHRFLFSPDVHDSAVKDLLFTEDNHQYPVVNDIYVSGPDIALFHSSLARLKRLMKIVGYANFSLLGFDTAVKTAKSYSAIGAFSKRELEFLEGLYNTPASVYGFLGDRTASDLTDMIQKKQIQKIPNTGHYLFRGKSLDMYDTICSKIGSDVVLTSGVRGIVKQFYLFLNKARSCDLNLSLASRSLAPPGYSFHGIGDFDVGKRGFGVSNFTVAFTQTNVYDRLAGLGFVKFRYPPKNNLGVRFEPWHIEVI